jgi:hypothetical protein
VPGRAQVVQASARREVFPPSEEPEEASVVPIGEIVVSAGAPEMAARRLGVAVADVAEASSRLWGRTFTAERDARASARAGAHASLRTVRAVRGHVTRSLLGELRAALCPVDPLDNDVCGVVHGPEPGRVSYPEGSKL